MEVLYCRGEVYRTRDEGGDVEQALADLDRRQPPGQAAGGDLPALGLLHKQRQRPPAAASGLRGLPGAGAAGARCRLVRSYLAEMQQQAPSPFVLALLLAACASVAHGRRPGRQRAAGRAPHRRLEQGERPWDVDPYDTWTQEGIPDHLRFWGACARAAADDQARRVLARADAKERRVPTFRPGLPPEKLVSLFEELYATAGTVTITRWSPRCSPARRACASSSRWSAAATTWSMQGVGWVAVRPDATWGEELYAGDLRRAEAVVL